MIWLKKTLLISPVPMLINDVFSSHSESEEITMTKFKKALATLMAVACTASTLCVPMNVSASATTTISESESNNTFDTADIINRDNVVINGKISSSSDVDYYRITPSTSGYCDITLSVPSGCNYNFYVYNVDRSSIMAYGNQNGSDLGEIARTFSSTNTPFYIKVESASGYSTTKDYKLYVSSGKGINKTWYSQYDNTANYGDYNINNLPTNFSSVMGGGCAICSIAMVLHNMNAHTQSNITDNRTGFVGKQYADPLTVYMARNNLTVQPTSASSSKLELEYNSNGTKVLNIGEYFGKTITRKTNANLSTVKSALSSNPYGVVVRLQKGSDSHYVVFYKASNSDGFVVYDPGTGQEGKGNGVLFNNSYSAINRSFTTNNITELITIS